MIIRLAFLPGVIEPHMSLTPIAYAALMVTALKACAGVSFIRMHPRAMIKRMSPAGEEPGL